MWLALLLPRLRRRRLAAAAALLVISVGCGGADESSDSETTTSTSSTSAMTSSSSSGAAVEGWPERWYGQYYQATDVDLGVESPSSPAFHFFYNISLEPAGVRVDYFDSTGEDSGTVMFSTQVDGDELVLVSDEGGDHVDWPPVSGGANETVVVQPGPDCSTLEQETTYTPPGTTYETTLRRGRICLVVPCDPDDGINCTVTVDLCTDDPAPTTCDGM